MFMTNTQYNEIFDFLVKRFDQIDAHFDRLETRVGSIETRMGNVESTLDFVLGEIRTLNEEKTVGSYRSRRMESWIQKASKKINLPYNP